MPSIVKIGEILSNVEGADAHKLKVGTVIRTVFCKTRRKKAVT